MKTDILCKYAAAVSMFAAAFLFNAHGAPSWCKEETKLKGACGHGEHGILENTVQEKRHIKYVENSKCPSGYDEVYAIDTIGDAFYLGFNETTYTSTANKAGCDCPSTKTSCELPYIYAGKGTLSKYYQGCS